MQRPPYPIVIARWASTDHPRHPDALAEAARSFVDTAACVRAGRDTAQIRMVEASATALGAAGTPGLTALSLGTAAHALDFDDYDIPASTHPSAVLVSALLALPGGHALRAVDLLEAYVVGYGTIIGLGTVPVTDQ